MMTGANIDMIKSVGFDSLKGTDDHNNAQTNIGLYNLTIDGNYKSDPSNIGDTGAINNAVGNGVSIYAGGIKLKNVTIYNCADNGCTRHKDSSGCDTAKNLFESVVHVMPSFPRF